MSIHRKLVKIQMPLELSGFLGKKHITHELVQVPFKESDPFIALMDDILDEKDDEYVVGPHPYAGVEIGYLLLEGEMGNMTHTLHTGDFEIVISGSGVIHTEITTPKTKTRLLRLWMNPPSKYRFVKPRAQKLLAKNVAVLSRKGIIIKIYSGSLSGLTSPVHTYTPLILAEFRLNPGETTVQVIPANFNTFLFVTKGNLKVGKDEKPLAKDQVGWLDLFSEDSQSELILRAGDSDTCFLLFAAKPTGNNIVVHGTFVADTAEDIEELYSEYRKGKMNHILTLTR